MTDYKNYFKGKKVTVLGLGLLGRAVGDAQFLAECGAELIVTDKKSADELRTSVEKLKQFPNVTFVLGEHRLEDFRNRDFILKAAGIPLDSPYVAEARKNGIRVEMSTALFAQFSPATLVGVTGTRGKSTTTHLVFEILKAAGEEVFLGGNIRGVSTLAFLPETTKNSIAVLELDSWQLQGFHDAKISPHVAVFTNFMDDHLNYYKNNTDLYFEDKTAIFKYQNKNDFLIAGEKAAELIGRSGTEVNGKFLVAKSADVSNDWHLKILGEHNRENTACAIEAARALGIKDEVIKKTVEEFVGVEGRLQFLREVDGVKIYNDNNATTPEATIAALRALRTESGIKNQELGKIVLIMGGADKGLDMSKLAEEIAKTCKAVVLLPGTGTERIKNQELGIKNEGSETVIRNSQFIIQKSVEVKNLQEAVIEAVAVSESGDIILFSPAFASFGLFKNEYDRNDQFVALVKKLKD